MFVGGIVVEDRVDQLAGRHGALDGIEEAAELQVSVALHAVGQEVNGRPSRNSSQGWVQHGGHRGHPERSLSRPPRSEPRSFKFASNDGHSWRRQHPERRDQYPLGLLLPHRPAAPALPHRPLAHAPLQADDMPDAGAGRAREPPSA